MNDKTDHQTNVKIPGTGRRKSVNVIIYSQT